MPTWILNQASTLSHRLLSDALAREGSRGYDYRVLSVLHEFGPSSQASLGRRAQMDRSDVVATVNALVARGFTTRYRDPADHRRNVIAMTASGRKHYRRLEGIMVAVQDRLLRSLEQGERQTLMDLLRRIVES
jgi:DNA-binding MarR family transcriptional regulator